MICQSNGFRQFLEFFSWTNFQLFLLIGSGILAIALMVLAVTRWGHSRPVWKCVILSVAAHILLIVYAFGTHLMLATPTVSQASIPHPVTVTVFEELVDSDSGEDDLDSSQTPWDDLGGPSELPDLDNLERAEFESDAITRENVADPIDDPSGIDTAAPLAAPPFEFATHDLTETPREAIPDEPFESPTIEPKEIEVARRGDGEFDQEIHPEFNTPEEIARSESISDPETAIDDVPQFTRPKLDSDEAFVSDLILKNSEFAVVPQSLPRPSATAAVAPSNRLRPIAFSRPRQQPASIPRRIGDGQPLPKIYALRSLDNRLSIAKQRGGSVDTERAVELALQWLAENQENNGRWDPQKSGAGQENQIFGHNRYSAGAQADSGITALATLAFLAAGHSHLEGKYKQEVLQGLEYLIRQQKPNGSLAGSARTFAQTYCHSMSLLALSEAFAMTGDQRLLQTVQRGVDFSVNSQIRSDGGWRYQPGDPSGDMSQFGWQVLALHSARLGGAVVPDSTLTKMKGFLESCSSGIGGGLASYRPGQNTSATMTAEALMCRFFLHQNVAPTTLGEATRRISSELPDASQVNLYYWYYGTLAMYHSGGAEWERWNERLKHALLPLQERSGTLAGSWAPSGVWGGYGGRVYSTAMATLNLEVYYRYLPLFQELADGSPTRETPTPSSQRR